MKNFFRKNLLIVGQTGSGRANFVEKKLITDFLKKYSPKDFRLILIDPKKVQLSPYNGAKHLINDVMYKPEKIKSAFCWVLVEMQERIEIFKTSDIHRYNELNPEKKIPEILIVIDEAADLMAYNRSFFEKSIKKITSLSDLVGIYVIFSTARPSPDYTLTKNIRESFLNRIVFKIDDEKKSILALAEKGAENLSKPGSCLIKNLTNHKARKFQMPYVSDEEVERAIKKAEKESDYKKIRQEEELKKYQKEEWRKLYSQAKYIILESQKASATFLQKKLAISYSKAANILDLLEEEGVISPPDKFGRRKIVYDK